MTLKNQKRRVSQASQKRSASHHKKTNKYIKPYWPYLPIIAIIIAGMLMSSFLGKNNKSVLGYATDVSQYSILEKTNAQRVAAGLGALALNGQLNSAAQAKAVDMVANDYWAHTSPSGLTPWYFISNSGYVYVAAAENLAYGFTTADAVVNGWMNSPLHRANILNGTYTELGVGVVNAPNFQNLGPQTVVVAMYAKPAPPPPPPPTTPPAAGATTPTAPAAGQTAALPKEITELEPKSDPSAPTEVAKKTDSVPAERTDKTELEVAYENYTSTQFGQPDPADVSMSKSVSRVEVISSANVAWTQYAFSTIASIAILIFLFRHGLAWHKHLARGKAFVLRHPMLDIAIVSGVTVGLVLLQQSGVIR